MMHKHPQGEADREARQEQEEQMRQHFAATQVQAVARGKMARKLHARLEDDKLAGKRRTASKRSLYSQMSTYSKSKDEEGTPRNNLEAEEEEEEEKEPEPPDDVELARLTAEEAAGQAQEAAEARSRGMQAANKARQLVLKARDLVSKAKKEMEKEKTAEAEHYAKETEDNINLVRRQSDDAHQAAAEALDWLQEFRKTVESLKSNVDAKATEAEEKAEAQKAADAHVLKAKKARKKIAIAIEDARLAKKAAAHALDESQKMAGISKEVQANEKAATDAVADADLRASEALKMIDEAGELAAEARRHAVAAKASDQARADLWIGEDNEAKRTGFSAPYPSDALRDDDDLAQHDTQKVLCRLTPRTIRLLSELRSCDVLWPHTGNGRRIVAPVGLAETRKLLHDPMASRNGDLVMQSHDGPYEFHVVMKGPRGTPYEPAALSMNVEFLGLWPAEAPRVRFLSPVYHCNVGEDGAIQPEALEAHLGPWKLQTTVFEVLGAISALICAPVPEAPARPELAALLQDDPAQYTAGIREYAREYPALNLASLLEGLRAQQSARN